MLIETDKEELGDKRLNPEEGLKKLKEENQALIDQRKHPDQEFLANKDAAKGSPLPISEFLHTLTRLNPLLLFKPSKVWGRDSVAIYQVVNGEPQYVTGFFVDTGTIPEWTSLENKDVHGLYSRTQRGWREVIVQLIKAKAINPREIAETFGQATGQRAEKSWHKQVQGRM